MNLHSLRTTATSLLVVALTAMPAMSFAQTAVDQESLRLIKAYASAAQSSDLEAIRSTWMELYNHPEAVEFMRKNMPQHYYLFQVRGLYFQINDIDAARQAGAFGESGGAVAPPDKVEPPKPLSVSEPEINPLPPNGEVVERSKNAVKVDNRQIAIGNPNQNRLDNKTIIENRAGAFYEQKFQKVPDVLVPGNEETNP